MVIDIGKMTLDNIHLYSLIGNIRKGQHLTSEEKQFLISLEIPKEKNTKKQVMSRYKLSAEEKLEQQKKYQHNYYLRVTKLKRQKQK